MPWAGPNVAVFGCLVGACVFTAGCGGTVTDTERRGASGETGGAAGTVSAGGTAGTGAMSAAGRLGSGGAPTVIPRLPDGGCTAPTVDDGTSCLERSAAISRCQAVAASRSQGERTDDVSCGFGCLCSTCIGQTLTCYEGSEPYCGTILDCARAHNCVGVACYQSTTCQGVIDAAPNGGLQAYSVAVASAAMDCMSKEGAYSNRQGPVCSPSCQ